MFSKLSCEMGVKILSVSSSKERLEMKPNVNLESSYDDPSWETMDTLLVSCDDSRRKRDSKSLSPWLLVTNIIKLLISPMYI